MRSVPDSEFITAISEPSFWEGRVVVKGTCMGEAVTGFGFVEVHGYQVHNYSTCLANSIWLLPLLQIKSSHRLRQATFDRDKIPRVSPSLCAVLMLWAVDRH